MLLGFIGFIIGAFRALALWGLGFRIWGLSFLAFGDVRILGLGFGV